MPPDTDPDRYAIRTASPRGFTQAYVHEGIGGVGPLVLVHGWPESKRIFWRVIAPLAEAGFEVIVPDLRGFGDSEVGPTEDDHGDVAAHSRDVHALVPDHLGHERAVLVGGDLGGPVVQDLALRFAGFAARMVLLTARCRTCPRRWPASAAARRSRRTPTCAASSSSARATMSSTPTSTAWRRSYSATTSAPSCCATAAHFVPWAAPHALVSAIGAFGGGGS